MAGWAAQAGRKARTRSAADGATGSCGRRASALPKLLNSSSRWPMTACSLPYRVHNVAHPCYVMSAHRPSTACQRARPPAQPPTPTTHPHVRVLKVAPQAAGPRLRPGGRQRALPPVALLEGGAVQAQGLAAGGQDLLWGTRRGGMAGRWVAVGPGGGVLTRCMHGLGSADQQSDTRCNRCDIGVILTRS